MAQSEAARKRKEANMHAAIEAHIRVYHEQVFVPMLQGVIQGFTQALIDQGVLEPSEEVEVELESQVEEEE